LNELLKHTLISIGGAFLLYQMQLLLHSNYLMDFLSNNLVSLLVAVLAINTASLGIVLSKIRELLDSVNGNHNFSGTKTEMLFSIKEQIVLIFLSLFLLTIDDSKLLDQYPQVKSLIEIGIVSCFVYAMQILYDTAKSIFVVLDFNQK